MVRQRDHRTDGRRSGETEQCCDARFLPPWPPSGSWLRPARPWRPGPRSFPAQLSPTCFKPWNARTKFFQWDEEARPYRIALVNGFVGNTWRIQMVKTAKAFAEQPGIKENIKEFKVVSTGTDVAAQLGAMEDFINQGFDAIVTIAVAPDGFDRIIRLADKNNVVVVPFDNILDTDKVMMVNEDQKEMGRMSATSLLEADRRKTSGKILEVRGLPGNSVDRDRHRRLPRGDGERRRTSSTSSRSSATGTPARRRR